MTTALVLYMPVIHTSYLELIDSQRWDEIFIMDNSLAVELVNNLRKDLRALNAETVRSFLVRRDGARPVFVVSSNTAIFDQATQFVLPDEDVSRAFADKYLRGSQIEFRNVFLRYDKKRTTEPFQPQPDEVVTSEQLARVMMTRCDELAAKSPDWWRQVGGLIVKDGTLLEELQMFNEAKPFGMVPYELGDPRSNFSKGVKPELSLVLHVEQGLVSRAARLGIALEGADLYVGTFPCPWCATALAYSGIKRVFYRDGYAMLDGEEILRSNNVELIRVVDV